MVHRPAVTVVICTWNRSELLRTTLHSLAGQQGVAHSDIEVLVVDNNSSDATRAMVHELQAQWPLGRLRYVFEGRQGKQFALNTGIAAARHEVLAFTDDDVLFAPDWLAQIQRLFGDGGVELAGGRTLIDWCAAPVPTWYSDALSAVLGGVDEGDGVQDPAAPSFAPGGGNLIARRRTFERHGVFSETHFRHMDHEFGIRCQEQGARVVYDPSLVVYAPVDARCLSPRYFKRWAFKAGIARSGGIHAAGTRPAVPLWTYRRLVQDLLALALKPWPGPADVFARRMRLWRDMGSVVNAWRGWLLPRAHPEWVERRSQKQQGLY